MLLRRKEKPISRVTEAMNGTKHPRPLTVAPREAHWAIDDVSYAHKLIFLTEAMGNLAWELAEENDPNSPFSHWSILARVREIKRLAGEWEADIVGLVGDDR